VPDASDVVDNPAASRLELHLDGSMAELIYAQQGDRLVLIHTEVPEALEGRGIGGTLVTAAVGRAERDEAIVVPRCPFARRWLERHPDVASRVHVDWPAAAAPDGEG